MKLIYFLPKIVAYRAGLIFNLLIDKLRLTDNNG